MASSFRAQVYYQIDSEDIAGPLDEQEVKACHFGEKNMKVGFGERQAVWNTRAAMMDP